MQRAFDRFTGFEEEFPSRIVAFSHWKMRFRPTTTSNTRWRAGSSSWFDGYSSRNSSCTYPRLSLPCIALASQEINPSDVTFEFSRRKGRIIIHFCTEVRFFYKFVKGVWNLFPLGWNSSISTAFKHLQRSESRILQ